MDLRRKTSYFIFMLLLIWPPIHAVSSRVLGFSSWRFFGWGMYATPHPTMFSSLSFFFLDTSGSVTKVSMDDLESLLEDQSLTSNFDYFIHFNSEQHLVSLVDSIVSKRKIKTPLTTLVVLTKQRIRLTSRRAYTENIVYQISNRTVKCLAST